MDIAEGAMFQWWTPSVFEAFIDQIVMAQAPPTLKYSDGFVPVVVPCHKGVDAASNDLSWTAGFAMISRWLVRHYGDHSFAEAHFSSLRRWVDGQLRNATRIERPGGLPDFAIYGDESALGRDNTSHVVVGQQVAFTVLCS